MKVGLIVPGFSSDATDWGIPVLVDVIRELSQRVELHVFALRYPHRNDRYHLHGTEVHALGGGTVRGLRRPALLAAACAGVIGEHRRRPFTALHGVWADEPGFVAVAAGRFLRIPAIVSIMGGELISMPNIGYGGHLAWSNRLLSAVALHGAARVTAGSTQLVELARPTLRPSRRSRIARLVWGIDPCLFELRGQSIELAGEVRVLHVGSLVPIKDQVTLLRAIARVKDSQAGIHLHIVGDGPLRTQLSHQARTLGLTTCVTFHGHVDRRALAAYYRAAHVLAVTSRYEAELVVALEAAVCGTPIVGTAVGLVADLAPQAAMVVRVGDDRALAEAIRAAVQAETGLSLETAARRLVRSDYLAAHTADGLLSIYRDAATPEMAHGSDEVPEGLRSENSMHRARPGDSP